MTARVDLTEFLSAYLAEVDEQLSLANGRTLAIEESLRKKETNPRAVRDLFRALHTIKGLSSMVGIEPVVAIAHHMEAVLRAADRAGGTLAPEALEPLIQGVRAIELRVRALSEHKAVPAPPGALMAALDALEAGAPGGAPSAGPSLDLDPALGAKLVAFEKQQILTAIAEGRFAMRLEFIPSAERAASGQTINSVREKLGALAEIVKVVPIALPSDARAPGGLAFVLLLVTTASVEELAGAAGVAPAAIRPILRVGGEPPALVPLADEPDSGLPEEQPERRNLLRVEVSRVDDAMEKLASLIVSRSRLARVVSMLAGTSAETRELKQVAIDIARQLRDLRSAILHVRMVRVSEILERIPLVVRGLRRTTGREVRLEVDAGETELDKAVAERIFPAILHLVRNAVDHGIEPPDDRRAAQKPEEGLIRITASARSNTQLELIVSDDGRGIDPGQIALRAGGEVPQTDATLLDLLCRPGFSTRDQVTTTSGRGMGMDIVRRVIVDQLGGDLLLTTKPGLGSTFTLRVPLTIAIVDAFTCQCGIERFVVPVSMVEEIVELEPDNIIDTPVMTRGGGTLLGMFERRGEAVPLIDLASLLRLRREGPPARRALVVRRGGQPVAFVLDRVLGQQEAVVRPLLDPLVHVPGVSGATDLGDGRPTLVLDLIALAATRPTKLLQPVAAVPLLAGGGERYLS